MPTMLRFTTDTATMCVFDIAAAKHRLADDADWWSIQDEEIKEMNLGNIAFLNLPADGAYSVEALDASEASETTVLLNCPSGRIFVGAAEEVTSDGCEPAALRGGGFLLVEPGCYAVGAKRNGNDVQLHFSRVGRDKVENGFEGPLRI